MSDREATGFRGLPTLTRVVILTVVAAVVVVVLFAWVFPWVEENIYNPTLDAVPHLRV